MKLLARSFYLAFSTLGCFSLAVASPTPNEYVPCHQQAVQTLSACLEKNPGQNNSHCWNESQHANNVCYAGVRDGHLPDKARINAEKKAAAESALKAQRK